MNLNKLWEIVEDRGAWRAEVHKVTKNWTSLSDWSATTIQKLSVSIHLILIKYQNLTRVTAWEGSDIVCTNRTLKSKLCLDFSSFSSNLSSLQFSSVGQSCPTLCDPMNRSTPGLPVHHQFQEFTQTHVHWVGDAIQPSHSLLSPSPPAPNPSQHQSLFQWVNSSHEVAKVLEFQPHQSFQWTLRADLL